MRHEINGKGIGHDEALFPRLISAECFEFPLLSASDVGDAQPENPAYTKYYVICRGAAGEPKLAIPKMRHLGSEAVQALSDEEHRRIVVGGTGKMKPVKGMSNIELDNVIAFIRLSFGYLKFSEMTNLNLEMKGRYGSSS